MNASESDSEITRYEVETREVWPAGDEAFVEIGRDELLLESEFRGANRVVMAIATPVHICGADTSDGERCQRTVSDPDDVCFQHEDDSNE